jgi:hypothetical protein
MIRSRLTGHFDRLSLSADGEHANWLQYVLQVISRTAHFVPFSQAVLCRAADLSIVGPGPAALAAIGSVYFALSLARSRSGIFGIEASLERSHRDGRFGTSLCGNALICYADRGRRRSR